MLLIVIVSCVSLIAAHGHTHGGNDHGHSHGDDDKPSFKYSKQANEQVKPKQQNHGHDCGAHGHSHDEHVPHHEELHQAKPKTKEVPAG